MARVAFCTTVRNRTQHLRETLPANLAGNKSAQFIVLNYASRDELLGYLSREHGEDLESGRLACYSYFDSPRFRMAHAKNLAHRLGVLEGCEYLVNIDADNLTGAGFDDFVERQLEERGDIFLWARMVPGKMVRGISGRIALSKQALLKSGGYDEKFADWGSDDKDLNLRLRALGYDGVEIDPVYLNGVPHNDKVRFKEYPHLIEMQKQGDEFFTVDRSTINGGVVNEGAFGCGTVYRHPDFSVPIHVPSLPCRIFGIGMHKTATTSLHRALELLGYESWHWKSAHEAKAIWREVHNWGRSPTVERYYALCDLPIPLVFKELDAAYPGSKFVLTLRDERKWLEAVMRHFSVAYNKWRTGWDGDPFTHRVHQLLYGRRDFEPDVMLERYRRHNAEVLEYFRHRPRDLLVMQMDQGAGWRELCRFLNCSEPAVAYPFENDATVNFGATARS